MRLFVSLSYNGKSYCGWQAQPNAPTVQATVERALSLTFGQQVSVVGAGRTDAGVNASYYVAHFDLALDSIADTASALYKMNAILPMDIRANGLYRVPDDAHARFDAVSRSYRYFVHTEKDPFAVNSCYFKFPCDMEAMNEAASCLLGEHDFSSFEKTGADNVTSICKVSEACWENLDRTHMVFKISANRFLRNMVRAIVGTLLEVGRGRHGAEWVAEVLAARDRGSAGQSVPGDALFLSDVRYPYPLTTI